MLISTLKNLKFRRYFLADVIAGFGLGMSLIGANWFVLEQTGSNKAVGILLSINILSGLLAFPFAGTIADRFSRKKVMIFANVVRAVVILFLAVTLFAGFFRINYVYWLAVISGMGWMVFMPASRGFIQEILTKEEYVNGSSLVEISMQVGLVTAAAACGVIYKYFGYGTILLINACTFVISSFVLYGIDHVSAVVHNVELGFFKQFHDGKKYLFDNPLILIFGIVILIPFVATISANVVLPGYVSRHLHADSVVFGIADMFYSTGACLAGFAAAWVAARLMRFRAVILFFLISMMALIYLIFNSYIAGLYIASLFFGFGNSSIRVVMNAQLMEIVPNEYMGRCQAVWMAVSTFLQVGSAYAVGAIMDIFPAQLGFLWLFFVMLIGFFGVLRLVPRLPFAQDSVSR